MDQIREIMRERSSASPHHADRALQLRARIQARRRARLAIASVVVVAAVLIPVVAFAWPVHPTRPAVTPTPAPTAAPLGDCVASPQTQPAGLLLMALNPGDGGFTTVATDPADALVLTVNGKATTVRGCQVRIAIRRWSTPRASSRV